MNLGVRVASAAVLIAVAGSALFVGGAYFDTLIAVTAGIAAIEAALMMRKLEIRPLWWLLVPLSVLYTLHQIFPNPAAAAEVMVAGSVVLGLLTVVLMHAAVMRWTTTICLALYVGLLGYFIGLFAWPAHDATAAVSRLGLRLVAIAVGGTIVSDTAAYFVGFVFGRHKLAPSISPGKTIEGAVGAVVACAVVVGVVAPLLIPISTVQAIVLGLLITVAGQLGDLAESAMKRQAGIKDSSALIPGHGGLLDRLDSLLLVAPAVYCYFTIIGLR